MHQVLEKVAQWEDIDSFEKKTLRVPYKTDDIWEYSLRYREALPAILHLIEDLDLQGKLHMYPEKRYVKCPNGNGIMCMYNEVNSANDWHEIQDALGKKKVVIYVCVYADATQLNAFGPQRQKRKGTSNINCFFTFNMSQVPRQKNDDSSHLAMHRARVYHEAVRQVFGSMEGAAKHRIKFVCEHNSAIHVYDSHPTVAMNIMDLEERYHVACLLGVQSKFSCPICLVPSDQQNNFWGTWPARTQKDARAILQQLHHLPTKKAHHELLSTYSLRDISNAFFGVCSYFFDFYRTFTADPLHEIEQGVYGKHIWPWMLESILDKDMQTHVDMHGVTALKYITVHEHNSILWYLAPIVTGLSTGIEHLLLPLLRHLGCILVLMRLDIHTDDTLVLLEEKIELFSIAAQMLHMARERDAVMHIQARMDAAEERALFEIGESGQLQASRNSNAAPEHIILGSPQHSIHISAEYKNNIMHISPNWRNSGLRHDHAMIQGHHSNKLMFAEVAAMFQINISGMHHKIAIVKFYQHLGHHHLSDYMELEKLTDFNFVFLDSFIHSVHILLPTSFYARSIVQDLADGDMYLCLIHTK
ncbi:hypothetical protein NM688_g517 [Phlebia brevispora]|uniref:Uncharacterized protein n=1 Tax=Phlebia brevispora TaxID=194682 RepID=A0ACC1TE42_9APHY|nr:hypothetical protein NM688_g517 [Phlebia brevispora]